MRRRRASIGSACNASRPANRCECSWDCRKIRGLLSFASWQAAPAGKADIRPNDLLLTAGGKKLTAVADLAAAVEAAKEESLKLQLLRGGKTIDVSVRPALRPENPQANLLQPGSDQETVERWLKQFGMNPRRLGGTESRWCIRGPAWCCRRE